MIHGAKISFEAECFNHELCICVHIISRLTGQQDDSPSDVPDACFIRAPMGVAEVLHCEVADALSCLMVTGSEELVSRVIRVKVQDGVNVHFPVTVVVPFCTRYRGNYRDVAVKIVDGERRASYITPVTTEGTYGGQRVRVICHLASSSRYLYEEIHILCKNGRSYTFVVLHLVGINPIQLHFIYVAPNRYLMTLSIQRRSRLYSYYYNIIYKDPTIPP